MAPPALLIIGGGFAGCYLAKHLSSTMTVTLVDQKDYFDITFANARTSVEPSLAEKTVIPYKDIPGVSACFKQATVTEVTASAATLDNGEVLKFDWCVLCTGCSNKAGVFAQAQSKTSTERKAEIATSAARIKAAKNLVIVGGGPLGIELAAEVVDAFAGKRITLVHSGPRLLEAKKEKMGNGAAKWLENNGVKVICGDRVEPQAAEGEALITKSGKTLPADLVIWTIGATPNTAFLRTGPLNAALDERGYVKVDESMRVKGFENIFALGDINNVAEYELGYIAIKHAAFTAKNLKAAVKGSKKLAAWKPNGGPEAMFVTLGKKAGVGHLGGCVCVGAPVPSMKSADLFVGQVRTELGVK